MSKAAVNRALKKATAALSERDPVMRGLIERHPPCGIATRWGERTHFEALCQSVAYQQLAGKAAAAIYGRFRDAAGGAPTPDAVLGLSEPGLRAVGLSGAKTRCLLALAERAASGELPLDDVDGLGDDELVARLSAVPGIGRWTAEMFLIFQLHRLDVWPVGDFAVRKGYARAYGLAEMPTPKALAALGDTFRPYRTVAAWYCWRESEAVLPGGSA